MNLYLLYAIGPWQIIIILFVSYCLEEKIPELMVVLERE